MITLLSGRRRPIYQEMQAIGVPQKGPCYRDRGLGENPRWFPGRVCTPVYLVLMGTSAAISTRLDRDLPSFSRKP
jgi:hypothetical protein